MNVGFVGYSSTKFDETKAKKIIDEIFQKLNKDDVVISGATNLGIPKLVYEKAKSLGMKTIGITAEEGKEYDMFPVDELIIEGKEFGDESMEFLSQIDVLYRIGGGVQSIEETKIAKEMNIDVQEYELDMLRLNARRKGVNNG